MTNTTEQESNDAKPCNHEYCQEFMRRWLEKFQGSFNQLSQTEGGCPLCQETLWQGLTQTEPILELSDD